jgi:hypothetical protein
VLDASAMLPYGGAPAACLGREMRMGLTTLEIEADVIFGEEGDSVLLGAFTLEALGLSLDPLRRDLKPLPMILAFQQG